MSSNERTFTSIPADTRMSSSLVSDALDRLGYRKQVLQQRLIPLIPGSRVLGRASTVQFAPSLEVPEEGPYDAAIAFIDSLQKGDVAVLATDGNNSTGYWGELFSAAAIGRSAAGMITDGNIRDSAEIASLGFPVFSAGRRPVDYRARMRIVAVYQRVSMSGVEIDHGDLVIADDDGVVIVPRHLEYRVLESARTRAGSESAVLAELLSGESLRSVWDRYKVL